MDTSSEVCFTRNNFNFYVFLLFTLIIFFVYIQFKKTEQMSNVQLNSHLSNTELLNKVKDLQDQLYKLQKAEQMCQSDLYETKQQLIKQNQQPQHIPIRQRDRFIKRIADPLEGPERTYSGGRINIPAYDDYQQIGFLYNNNERYPLYGRPKYPGRTDKYEYYIIDESRNRLKIPIKTRNYDEIYDGDDVPIDILNNTYKAKTYEYETMRYNPNPNL
jgi:hypothetical protein